MTRRWSRSASGGKSRTRPSTKAVVLYASAMRVFVLGAGASRHAGYPILRDLWAGISSWIQTGEGHASEFIGLDRQPAPIPQVSSKTSKCFGKLSKTRFAMQNLDKRQFFALRRELLLSALISFFRSVGASKSLTRVGSLHAITFCPGDVVVTFKLDVSLEKELRLCDKWQVFDGYGFLLGLRRCLRRP